MTEGDLPIEFSGHSLFRLYRRGGTREEVEEAIREGESLPAKVGRTAYRKNFTYQSDWKGRYYETKQVMPIVVEEEGVFVVITVYVYFFGEREP